jgi:tetratricopeptide (TPR) repeat protein
MKKGQANEQAPDLRMKDIVLKRQQIPPISRKNLSTRAARGAKTEPAWRSALETDSGLNRERLDANFCSNLGARATPGEKLRLASMDRIAMLSEILTANPNDAFARYGLAMECSNRGEVERALEEFGKLLAAHPDYTAGYFMAAQTLTKVARTEEAKRMLNDGIRSAERTGNSHARSEMEAMLSELG